MEYYEKRGYLKGAFRLFHVTDQKQEQFRYHYHDFDKIICFLKGNVTYHIEGHSYLLKPYDLLLIQHHQLHKPVVHDTAPYERIVIYLSPDFLISYQDQECPLNRCFLIAEENHSHLMRGSASTFSILYEALTRFEYACHHDGYANQLYCKVLFLEFLILLNRSVTTRHLECPAAQPAPSKVLQIISYINEHLTEDLSVGRLAGRFYLSKYHMMRIFKQETGHTLGQYISQKRLLYARELLKAKMPVTMVCFECGFQNYSTFSRAYKQQFGNSPKQDFPNHICSEKI